MLDKQFDNIINQKLKDVMVDVPESDWNVFSQKLKVAMESTGPEDHLFDEAIKSKLAAADIDTPKPEWNAFAAMLKADADTGINEISDADFDAAIKDKVSNPDIEIPKADWPVFSGILAASTTTTDLSDSAFDNVIQNKLQNNSIDIPTPNWNAFSQKLQEASLTDQDLDTEVKAKLENYSTQFNESHWSILRDKMIETRFLRTNLYGLKAFEGALAILLFMTFANFIADKFIPDSILASTEIIVSNIAQGQSISTETNTITVNTADNTKLEATTATNTSVAKPARTRTTSGVTATSETTTVVSDNAIRNNVGNLQASTNTSTFNGTASNPAFESNNNPVAPTNNGTNEVVSNGITTTLYNKNSNKGATIAGLDRDDKTLPGLANIMGLTPGLFNNTRDQLDLNVGATATIKAVENIENNGWALHATIGNNNHMISTPQDTFVYNLPYSRSSNNLNFDFRISKEFNQVELMTGIAYQAMRYGSTVTETIDVDGVEYDYSIAEIRYDFIKIPLAARWNYSINDKFNFFADLGISANILAASNYNIEGTEIDLVVSSPKPQPVEELPDNAYASWENSSLARKNYQEGIFSGASLKESIYGTLDTGLGINYKLNNQIETYVRGTVNQALGQFEIGPNHDSFTTFGLQLGMKYKLTN